ncbi:MAG: hypothetical protein AB7Y74_12895, partial [Syntrophorhabdus sp.]
IYVTLCYSCNGRWMMSVAIRIDNELYEEAKRSAEAECRTVPLQVIYWAKIGKAALDNPDLPIEFIRDTLSARKQGKFEPFSFSTE